MGIHQCVGQHVARLEAICVLDALLDRVVDIELAGPERRHLNNTLRRLGAHAGAGHPGLNEAGTDAAASVPAVDRSVRR